MADIAEQNLVFHFLERHQGQIEIGIGVQFRFAAGFEQADFLRKQDTEAIRYRAFESLSLFTQIIECIEALRRFGRAHTLFGQVEQGIRQAQGKIFQALRTENRGERHEVLQYRGPLGRR